MPALSLLRLLPGVMILALLLAVIGLKSNRDKWERQAIRSEEMRKIDRQTYEAAQVDAARKNQAQVQQIEAEHEKITVAVRSDYQRDLERLRAQARANQGSAGKPGVSQVPQATGGTGPEVVQLPPDQLLRAQEIELQLNALIDWIERQATAQ